MLSEETAFHFNRGIAFLTQGKPQEAEASFRRALELDPDRPELHNNLAKTLIDQRRLDEALDSYRRAIEIAPAQAAAHYNIANLLRERGAWSEAEQSYRRALDREPQNPDFHNNLGNLLKDCERYEEAIACYRQAIALAPEHYRAYFNLGVALQAGGGSAEAAQCFRRVLALNPDHALAHSKLAELLKFQGRAGEAAAYYRRAVELAPDNLALRSALLVCLQYDPAMTPGALLVEHRRFAAALPARAVAHANPRDPDRPLNIGYLSADLRQHPVGLLLMPVVATHDRAMFRVHCYYGQRQGDDVTAFISSRADVWRSTVGLSDEEVAAMVQADRIDILVDLAGHTLNNRLPVFALRPAPVQATWAGYFGTTGLDAIDYLISDRYLSPPGSERYSTEKPVHLPDGYICWAAPGNAPAVAPPPASSRGAVTFGCFNNPAKINPQVIALWGQLLRELPSSRLVLKAGDLDEPAVSQRIRAMFVAEQIAGDRIVLLGNSPLAEYFRCYNDIDIALDPFPYSGGLTTFDALWMGVPVVTLPGERFASRHSLSHLSAAGLGELAADGPEGYLRIAKELAHDLPRLTALRADMRDRLRRSPLLQAERFTRGLEAAYRWMWRRWCEVTAV
jgi:protein O-GlcNAc transferase